MSQYTPDSFNQNNKSGPQQSGQFVIGVVTNVNKDASRPHMPEVRLLGHEDNQGGMQDQTGLQDVRPLCKGTASRTVGHMPLHSVGDKVLLCDLGQQGYVIVGTIPNDQEGNSGSGGDLHPQNFANGSPVAVISGMKSVYNQIVDGKNILKLQDNTRTAYNMINGITKNIIDKVNPFNGINDLAKIPERFGVRTKIKVPKGQLQSIGSLPFKGELKNLQQFMQTNNIPSLIPNALQMLESLKSTVTKGLNIPYSDAVGGIQNIIGAIQGISSMHSAVSQGFQEQTLDLFKQEMYRLYRLQTKLEPLDQFGNETVQFEQWLNNYIYGTSTGAIV